MTSSPQLIGRKVLVDLPSHGISDIPAKVDTGADSSSLWASDIREEDGQLSFVLFGPSSSLYTGERIITKQYSIISVKNSFGMAEYRYKVILPAVIEGRTIKVRFTLADRSRNSSPILIGRKTLQGKFVVDVAHDPMKTRVRRVLIVSAKESESVGQMVEAVEGLLDNVTIDRATYDDIVVRIVDGTMSAEILATGEDLAAYDMIHFKTSLQRDITASLARYASAKGVRVLDEIIQYFPTTSKLYQYGILTGHGMAVPDSVFVTPRRLMHSYRMIAEGLSLPFVLKSIHSSKGQYNEVVRSEDDFRRIVVEAERAGQYLIAQAFIPNDGDFRVLVFGKRVALIIHRVRHDDSTHLNNTSTGGKATLVEQSSLPPQVIRDSIEATRIMQRDIAGVDMVKDQKTDQWYCFEVNDGPQLASGSFVAEKQQALADYLRRELDK